MGIQILVGIDHESGAIVPLLKRLDFPYAHLEVAHVLSGADFLAYGVEGYRSANDVEQVLAQENRHTRQRVESVARDLSQSGSKKVTAEVLFGHPVEGLLHRAEALRAELIAVNAAHTKSEGGAVLSGSIARALLMAAPQSVLIGRPSQLLKADEQPVRAVFATDHSDYANRCIEKLIDFGPQGLTHLTLMTAAPEVELEQLDRAVPKLGISISASVRQALERRNQALVQKLHKELPKVEIESVVLPMPIHEALERAMDRASADLLILGAKGHSLVERLTLGSVSLRAAMTAAYSVLVLRA